MVEAMVRGAEYLLESEAIHLRLNLGSIIRQGPPKSLTTKLFCIKFCDVLSDYSSHFAVVGGCTASVYKANDEAKVDFLQAFVDEDATEEDYYCCCWSSSSSGAPLLLIAGLKGVLKVINCINNEIEAIMFGHGSAINDLRSHPLVDGLVFSASKDESIRLWNVRTAVCVAIFAGEKGHRDEVLSIDPHPLGLALVSGGMDTSVKIWNLQDPILQAAQENSFADPDPNPKVFKTFAVEQPVFSSTLVHNNYVDSVMWVGNFIASKSTKNVVSLWAPDSMRHKGAPLVLKEFSCTENDLWFVRMDVCVPLNLIAVGNRTGKVFIYSISAPYKNIKKKSKDVVDEKGKETAAVEKEDEDIARKKAKTVVTATLVGGGGGSKSSSSTASTGTARFEEEDEEVESQDGPLLLGGVKTVKATAILTHPTCMSVVRQVSFDPLGRYISYCCDDGSVWLWSISIDNV